MTVTIPDEALHHLDLTPEQARLEIAVGLFAANKVSTSKGARIAGVPFLDFQREVGRRRIPMHYTIADYHDDMRTVAAMPKT